MQVGVIRCPFAAVKGHDDSCCWRPLTAVCRPLGRRWTLAPRRSGQFVFFPHSAVGILCPGSSFASANDVPYNADDDARLERLEAPAVWLGSLTRTINTDRL